MNPPQPLVSRVRRSGNGIGAFNVILLEHSEAIVHGAERAGLPVVLQVSQNAVRYHGALAPIVLATRAVADRAGIEALVHLDHALDATLVREAVGLGVGSVMYDASALDYAANVAACREVVGYCHDHGVVVEAELGEVGGKDGVHAPGARTDPNQAAEFVAATGVDSLAVAVGTSHAMTERVGSVDVALIGALAAALPVPLVLHGSSGLPDEQLQAAVRAGITKVNIGTHLNVVFTSALQAALAEGAGIDPRRYLAPARSAVAGEVARLLGLLARPEARA